MYKKNKKENLNQKFKERDPEENERLRKALGLRLEEKFVDLIKSSPWEQLGAKSWL